MPSITKKQMTRIVNETVSTGNEKVLQLLEENLTSLNKSIEMTLKSGEYDLLKIFDYYKRIKNTLETIQADVLNTKSLITNSNYEKLYFLINIKSGLEKFKMVIDMLINEAISALKRQKEDIKSDERKRIEDAVEKMFNKLEKEHIDKSVKKIDKVIAEMRKFISTISTVD